MAESSKPAPTGTDHVEQEFAESLRQAAYVFENEKDGRFRGSIFACRTVARFIHQRNGGAELAAPFLQIAMAFQDLEREGKREVARDRVLSDQELAQVILAARKIGGSYGGIVELLALTGQRREEVARLQWEELDLAQRVWRLPRSRTKNAKAHVVHLSEQSVAVLRRLDRRGPYVFSPVGNKPFQKFSKAKRLLDQLSGVTGWRLHDLRRTCVSGMAQLGVAPHVADKILNHQSGAISGVAAVYQRHEFIAERRTALDLWGTHVSELVKGISPELRIDLKIVA